MAPLGLIAERYFLCIGRRAGACGGPGKTTHNGGVTVGDAGLSWLHSLAMPPLQDLDAPLRVNPCFGSISEGDARRTVPNTVPKWSVYFKTVVAQRSYMQIRAPNSDPVPSQAVRDFFCPRADTRKAPLVCAEP